MPFEQQLRIPGPTPLPQRVLRALSRPMINHRGPEFAELLKDVCSGLQWALQTENDILLWPSSGTGGLEAAVVNLLSPGEKALFATMGSFGERWADIAEAYGVDVIRLACEWGQPVDPGDVDRILGENAGITKMFVTHNETSTGVVNDMAAIAAVAKRHGCLIAVDSVSGAGCMDLPVDDLGIDVVVTGSQKGWLAPPGLAMIAVGKAAFAAAEKATLPRWYFDFAREKLWQDRSQTYTTPPIATMHAVQEGLAIMREEGLQEVFDRHACVAGMIRSGLEAIGLRLFAQEGSRSNTVTAVHHAGDPAMLRSLLATLRVDYGLVLAGGQGKLDGKLFRIGHLGMVDERDVYAILATLEQGMVDRGMLSRTGLTVAAAQAARRTHTSSRAPEPVA